MPRINSAAASGRSWISSTREARPRPPPFGRPCRTRRRGPPSARSSAFSKKKATCGIESRGRELVYLPTRSRGRAGRSALRRVLETFFDGSLEKALAAHLSDPGVKLPPQELERLMRLIHQAEQKQRE